MALSRMIAPAILLAVMLSALGTADAVWIQTRTVPAAEAHQAAAVDELHVYAITNNVIARYDRETGRRISQSTGAAEHLNSGFLTEGRLYCAHSNYPKTPERSEIKVLDLTTLQLTTFHDFGNFGGSLTWAVLHGGHWWCNFARYGAKNDETFLVEFDSEWRELRRWTYPPELIRQLGRNSLSGGLWRGDELLVTGHDDPVLFHVRLPMTGTVLDYAGSERVPFTGQGIATDPKTGGLVGIDRAKKQIVFAEVQEDARSSRTLLPELRHLRSGPVREWLEFPENSSATALDVTFTSDRAPAESALIVRQQDVKQVWHVRLNGQKLGELTRDENEMWSGFSVEANLLRRGDNQLQISAASPDAALSDDIRVGSIRLEQRPLKDVLAEAALEVDVRDAETHSGLPCRITIVDRDGVLVPIGTPSSSTAAVRTGVAYLATGRARLQLPAGQYTVYAGRGLEYSLTRKDVAVVAGQSAPVALEIRREVPTDGYIACDTHVHTLTHSGHGDATIEERMLTIAGEGIELPIATDHNKHIDYEATARSVNLREHFTPVRGNEVTTGRGHFNIFPVPSGSMMPNHRLGSWRELLVEMVSQTDPPVIILNHAQDLHSGVRPFGPKLFNAVVAEHVEEWSPRLNAMEVINSGATQSDPLQLFHNWMALLNRGRMVTPIGSSDSHDVARHFIGQGRTYIRCEDRDPGAISIPQAVEALQRGRVLVSYGLLTELTVNGEYRSGDVAPVGPQTCRVDVRVLGPHWTSVRQVRVFANGQLLREMDIAPEPSLSRWSGVLWSTTLDLPLPSHDVHLVAIATGPGIAAPYWRTAKPYQPTSPNVDTQVIGSSGAVWLDVDDDGRATPARTYAERLMAEHRNDLKKMITALESYDAAVAAHVAYLQHQKGMLPTAPEVQTAWRSASPAARQGFQNYVQAWRECEIARQSSGDDR